ncbi:flagellar biosynthesis protein FlhF [Paenibacillus sp. IB182496]|uniref:Flagellar biosynthesis protein FlhF n=1 Tax=Paenibacillus sabuli TaxID=2772509 RepID=A0A927BT37_9BACL|nr:flagellar biosynthesis protein FlhF [Paenibacillus sabuli]MBD2845270.1 flagellar biosynthesis protein FlhF [Paenibacillus sabuli]
MKVKRYVVQAVPDALPLIRNELGKNAVILTTKEIRVGGFLGMFRKRRMEVLAASEEEERPVKPRPQTLSVGREAAKPAAQELLLALQADAETGQALPPVAAAKAQPAAGTHPTAPDSGAGQQKQLMDEIRQMKQMVEKLSRFHSEEYDGAALLLRERLAAQELEEEWIVKLLEAVTQDERYAAGGNAAELWALAANHLRGWLAPLCGEPSAPSARVVYFVGPTGVGKTTTVAKLAAEQKLKHRRNVGFITSDTYRIAAVDQLRTYATILDVPLEVVFSPAELSRAFKQLESCEMIFMDTAGRNFRNELYVSEVNALLQANDDSETFLVLSLTGRTRDMSVVADHFAKYGVGKVIFTKRDETDAVGAIANIMLRHPYQTAYIGFGQNVPDDIEAFDLERYLKTLLGDPSDA